MRYRTNETTLEGEKKLYVVEKRKEKDRIKNSANRKKIARIKNSFCNSFYKFLLLVLDFWKDLGTTPRH